MYVTVIIPVICKMSCVYMFLVFVPDECIVFPFLSLLDQICIFLLDAFLLFSSASDPAPDEVLEVLERLSIHLLCISTF